MLPPSFGEACFASRDHRLYTHEENTLLLYLRNPWLSTAFRNCGNSIAVHPRLGLAIWWARQQAAAKQGASKLAHSKGPVFDVKLFFYALSPPFSTVLGFSDADEQKFSTGQRG
ncbi:MAG TPA: hypothetical protein VKD72_26210, partial [Gemmataceae bacterium]|nr:hypothetical protein [Gemmataceae bacterium]